MISKDKEYKTKHGNEVRIYATDCGGRYSVHGAFRRQDGTWSVEEWTEEGHFYDDGADSDLNLVESKPRIKADIEVDVVRYHQGGIDIVPTDTSHTYEVIGRTSVSIDIEEGEGL